MKKKEDRSEPKETTLKEAYYKRYGVHFAADIVKKVTANIALSLRDIYNIIKGKND